MAEGLGPASSRDDSEVCCSNWGTRVHLKLSPCPESHDFAPADAESMDASMAEAAMPLAFEEASVAELCSGGKLRQPC
jgi:hypothetical protein